MSQARRCPQCGAELPPDAPEGVCPKCVLGLGFASQQGSSPGAAPHGSSAKPDDIHGLETVAPSSEQGGGEGASGVGRDAGPADTGAYRGPFTAPTPEELAKHFPQLEIIELLGQGGMGAVYKARQPGLDRLVAVKILPPEAARDPAFAQRFTREARALAKLNHPNIVAVYDFGQAFVVPPSGGPETSQPAVSRKPPEGGTTNGLFYFIMEYVDGVNLRELIRSGQCKPEDALRIVPQICEALQFAHDEGIVHRDIKPENILLDKRGRLKIADFGLARLLGRTRTDYTLTGPWQVMGTPNYMAPEQFDDPLKVDHRADIYALGVVFYEMLTGELPRGRFAPPSQKVQVDVRLDEVVLRALEQEPERRYQQASEVKTDVEAISRSERVARAESAQDVATLAGSEPTPFADSGPDTPPRAFVGPSLGIGFWILLGIILVMLGFQIAGRGSAWAFPFILGGLASWIAALVAYRRELRRVGPSMPFAGSVGAIRPERRYQQASEVKTDVETTSNGLRRAVAPPPSPDQAQPKQTERLVVGFRRHIVIPMLLFYAIYVVAVTAISIGHQRRRLFELDARLGETREFTYKFRLDASLGVTFGPLVLVAVLLLLVAWWALRQLRSKAREKQRGTVIYVARCTLLALSVAGLVGFTYPSAAGTGSQLLFRIGLPFSPWLRTVVDPGTWLTELRVVSWSCLCAIVSLYSWLEYLGLGRRKIGRPATGWIVAAVLVVLATLSAGVGVLNYLPSRPLAPGPEVATLREIATTEAERSTPGLSVFRYELHLPRSHYAEFSTEFWRHGKPERSEISLSGGKVGNGQVELRLQQGETLSPEGKGKLRWDWRAEAGGVKVETGGWIDDPFAGISGRTSSWRGTESWQLRPGTDHTLLILRGWEQPTVPLPPEEYARNPTALAGAIQRGEIPRADVELYLKVRIRRE